MAKKEVICGKKAGVPYKQARKDKAEARYNSVRLYMWLFDLIIPIPQLGYNSIR